MKKIRYGMFETNSSSTHTIIVTDNATEPGNLVDFAIGEFGWERDTLCTIDEKASYLYTMACYCRNEDVYPILHDMLSMYGVECSCSVPARFKQYKDYDYLDNGYVDHGTDGDAYEFVDRMLSDEYALIKFLFSDESFIITGNDNCEEFEYDEMKRAANVDYPHTTYYKGN